MTQREWDRIVGWGKMPATKSVNYKFTNHVPTYERHPETIKKNAKD